MNHPIDIERDRFVHLRSRGRERVRVTCGRVWLTVEGDLDDHVLARGQSLPLPRGARVLVQALDAPARLVVHRPTLSWVRWLRTAARLGQTAGGTVASPSRLGAWS
ncbi:MAG: DUF2917 domain-containing protein [Aquincola sp.]|nr:DUF2917 domain-containing protein [Aquincola sp.]MDH5331198.1 DUF2917 domain-containing protein [Aquincola sp.]